jgi:hypothetical protein
VTGHGPGCAVLEKGVGSSLVGDEFLDLLPPDALLVGPAEVISTDDVDARGRLGDVSVANLPTGAVAIAVVNGFRSLMKLSSLAEGLGLGCTGDEGGNDAPREDSFGLRSARGVHGGVPGGVTSGEVDGEARGEMPVFLATLSWKAFSKQSSATFGDRRYDGSGYLRPS